MRRWTVVVAAVGAALTVMPGVASGQTEDSVTGRVGTGQPVSFAWEFDAHSGPSGENPSGTVIGINPIGQESTGSVLCLVVSGTRAVIGVAVEQTPFFATLLVEDNDGLGVDRVGVTPLSGSPPSCEDPTTLPTQPVTAGDLQVVDAQPFPTSKDQCKDGGWRTYGVFKNQGDCVSFVATGGKNPPAGNTAP